MTTTTKAEKATPTSKRKRTTPATSRKKKEAAPFPKTTPWAKEFFKRLDKLREALGDTKLV